jgi:hypothetical protein
LTTTLLTLAALIGLSADTDARIKPLAGESMEGQVQVLTAEQVVFASPGGDKSFAAADLMSVDFDRSPATDKPNIWVELLDGSKLNALNYGVTSGKAKIELTSGETVEVARRSIASVRFREQDAALADQWREILQAKATGDVVVVRKTSMQTVEQNGEEMTVTMVALDQLEGTVLDVGPESAQFQFEGETIPVRRDKLEGIVYYQPARREYSGPACRLIDSGGSAWSIKSMGLDNGKLRAESVGGVAFTLPLEAVAKIDYSVGNVSFLADMEPDTGGGDPAVSLQPSAMAFKFGRVFTMRPGPPLGASAFQINNQRYDGGLSLHSPAKLVYRVPEDFRWLRAVAGVDDSVVAAGRFDFVVLGDGKELLRHAFGPEERGPLPIDLDITGVRRITIQIDPADGQDIGDQLNLCEARMTK